MGSFKTYFDASAKLLTQNRVYKMFCKYSHHLATITVITNLLITRCKYLKLLIAMSIIYSLND